MSLVALPSCDGVREFYNRDDACMECACGGIHDLPEVCSIASCRRPARWVLANAYDEWKVACGHHVALVAGWLMEDLAVPSVVVERIPDPAPAKALREPALA